MRKSNRVRWTMVVAGNVLAVCMLGFFRTTTAAPPSSGEPFANSVEQRAEIIKQLQEMNSQLKEQNSLIRGALKALVGDKN